MYVYSLGMFVYLAQINVCRKGVMPHMRGHILGEWSTVVCFLITLDIHLYYDLHECRTPTWSEGADAAVFQSPGARTALYVYFVRIFVYFDQINMCKKGACYAIFRRKISMSSYKCLNYFYLENYIRWEYFVPI